MHLVSICIIILWACAYPSMSQMLDGSSVVKAHIEWKIKHGRTYANASEMQMRFKIFKENFEYIEEFNNAGNNSYTLALNPYSDLTSEEFLASYTGLDVPSRVSSAKLRSNSVLFNITDLPVNFDWRENGAVTDIKAQGTCAGCWAFAAVAAIEGMWKIREGALVRLSEQQLIDCDTKSNGCTGGDIVKAYKYVIENDGILEESKYQFTEGKRECKQIDVTDTDVFITTYIAVKENDEGQLLQAVARQPVAASLHVNSDFQSYGGGVYSGTCGPTENHAVVIVGYGITDDGKKYWLIKNSWGQGWGEKGYMRLIREGPGGGPEGHCGVATYVTFPSIE